MIDLEWFLKTLICSLLDILNTERDSATLHFTTFSDVHLHLQHGTINIIFVASGTF